MTDNEAMYGAWYLVGLFVAIIFAPWWAALIVGFPLVASIAATTYLWLRGEQC